MGPVTELEMNLVPVLADIELQGIGFDLDMFKRVQDCAKAALPDLVKRICTNFNIKVQRGFQGMRPVVNLDSHQQLKELLANNGIEVEDTESDTLEEASKIYPILTDLIEYKKLTKALTFPYDKYVHPITRRVHPSFNQLGAGTARLSSSHFNIQQVPKLPLQIPQHLWRSGDEQYVDKKTGVAYLSYRHCFVSSKLTELIGSDYSGQELCVIAATSGDPTMCAILSEPELLLDGSKNPAADLHSIVGAEMFGVTVLDVMNGARNSHGIKYRDNSKIVSFGLLYGKGVQGFAKDWGVSEIEAEVFLNKYFGKFPVLKRYLDKVGSDSYKTRLSRFPEYLDISRLRFLEGDKGSIIRAAMNSPTQGTSATMIKLALVTIAKRLKEQALEAYLVLTVHDEILAESSAQDLTAASTLIKSTMEEVGNIFLRGLVPARANTTTGITWPK
jgi:DNA polymerase-1